MFCPLEEQHSIALVMLDLAAVEATVETGDCCFRWGSEQQEQLLQSESDPVSLQMLFINKDL